MATIRMTLVDDDGVEFEKTFDLRSGQFDLESLDGIESAVEQFRLEALPDVEQCLLQNALGRKAQAATEEEKKETPRLPS